MAEISQDANFKSCKGLSCSLKDKVKPVKKLPTIYSRCCYIFFFSTHVFVWCTLYAWHYSQVYHVKSAKFATLWIYVILISFHIWSFFLQSLFPQYFFFMVTVAVPLSTCWGFRDQFSHSKRQRQVYQFFKYLYSTNIHMKCFCFTRDDVDRDAQDFHVDRKY